LGTTLGLEWNFLRTPTQTWWSLLERPGALAVQLLPAQLSQPEPVALVARRQQHMNFRSSVTLEFSPTLEMNSGAECAGMVVFYSDAYHFRFVRLGNRLELIERKAGQERTVASVECGTESGAESGADSGTTHITLEVSAVGQEYHFAFAERGEGKARAPQTLTLLAKVEGSMLSAATAGGFVGTYLGIYASSNGERSSNTAYFSDFVYQGQLG
jgi:xylan 1,4-beta-xylosidase